MDRENTMRLASRALLLTLLGAICLVEAAGKQNVQQRLPRYPSEATSVALAPAASLSSDWYKEPILVSLLDGKLIALDGDTGHELWTYDSGQPLLAASGPKQDVTADRNRVSAVQSYAEVFPGWDGTLYSYEGKPGSLKVLYGNVAEMANSFPSRRQEGELVKGSNAGGFLFLDPLTGVLQRAPLGDGIDLTAETLKMETPRPYIVGWQRYLVHSVDENTGETLWKVTYGKMRGVGPNEGKLSDLTGLEASSNGTLMRRDTRTGEVMWDLQLPAAALAAFTGSGAEISLNLPASNPEPGPRTALALPEGRNGLLELGEGVREPKVVMVGQGSNGLYALPAPRGHSSTGLSLPGQVSPSLPLEVGEEPVAMLADDCGPMWTCPLGVHQIEELPPQEQITLLPPAQTRNDSPSREMILSNGGRGLPTDEGREDDDGSWNKSVMGWLQVGAGAVVGAALFGMLTHQYDVGKPRLWTTLDKSHKAEGIVTMQMSYTGSQNEAAETAKAALQNELAARAATPQLSTIRDHTGSGIGNNPDDNARRARKRWKKLKDHRYSNKMMGAIKESPLEGDSSASEDEEEEEQDEDEEQEALVDDEDSLPPMQAAAGDNTAHSSGRSSTVQSREVARAGVSRVGRMEIGPEILGYGSSGTLVFEGTLHGRPIAVKRILSQFYELARKEIGALILSDEHPNIVRCFAMEEDNEFVYLALERCRQSLNDLVNSDGGAANFLDDARRPTPFCMQVVEEAGHGVVALHQRGIVHRDIKPQNILLTESRHAKLSDMGLCKRLAIDQSSFESRGPGGSTGWQAPEQLISRSGGDVRQGKSVDIFSFGLVIFYCLTGGKHAFGESYERDFNILQGRASLREVAHLKEAENLVRAMLVPAPKRRPSIASVMAHPFWWPPQRRLSFLVDLSDRMENEDREEDQSLLAALEACSEEALGGRNWMARLDPDFLENLGRYRKYRPDSLRDLLRVIRNKHNHFRELPEQLQAKLGPMPDGFLSYFSSRFPNLLMATYCFGLHRCSEEPMLAKYYPAGAREFPLELMSTRLAAATGAPATAANAADAIRVVEKRALSMPLPGARPTPLFPEPAAAADSGAPRAKSAPDAYVPSSSSATPASREQASSQGSPFTSLGPMRHSASPTHLRGPASAGVSGRSSGEANGFQGPRNGFIHRPPPLPPPHHRSSSPSNSARSSGGRSGYSAQQPPPPPSLQRSSPSGSIWSMNGSSMLGPNWAYMPPPDQSQPYMHPQQHGPRMGSADSTRLRGGSMSLSSSAVSEASGGAVPPLQHRIGSPGNMSNSGSPPKTGGLSDGMNSVASSMQPPPLKPSFPCRPGQPLCDFYTKTGHCKFGEACKFDHPAHFGVQLNSLGLPLRQGESVCGHFEKTHTCKFGPACKFHHPEPLHGA